jgi:glutamate/tyrosine decarboxylase-like PLP-dependent enzyme
MRDLHTPDVIRTTLRFLESVLTEQYLLTEEKPLLRFREKEDVLSDLFEAEPPSDGMGLERALELYREKVSPDSVQTWHPAFFNQMSTGASLPAVLGNTLASMINGTLSTFEASPSATVIERVVARWMARLLGMKPGSSGIFISGSSIANFMALVVARNKNLNPELKQRGLQNVEEQGVVLCSEASHYSIKNAVNLMGLGTDRLVMVKTNERNEMRVDSLREALEDCDYRGLKPFAIVATLGSTVTGGFDPLADIIEVCRGRNIHVHVDAAFGGGMALTKRAETCFKGIEEADTVTWDAHKWLHAPLTCTVLLAPNPRIFRQSFNSDAEYLFHAPNEPVSMVEDLGQYTVFCGKRFHALAIWLMFQAYGETFFSDEA